MENSKKRINIIDLIFTVILVLIVLFGIYKLSGVDSLSSDTVVSKIVYTVEVQNQDEDILNYIKPDDKVFEDESLKSMGTVTDVQKKPYMLSTEDKENKRILNSKMPDKVSIDVKISADAKKTGDALSVDGVNILVGKTIDLNAGNSYFKGVIIDIEDDTVQKEEE